MFAKRCPTGVEETLHGFGVDSRVIPQPLQQAIPNWTGRIDIGVMKLVIRRRVWSTATIAKAAFAGKGSDWSTIWPTTLDFQSREASLPVMFSRWVKTGPGTLTKWLTVRRQLKE
jgi:hypothetical protein